MKLPEEYNVKAVVGLCFVGLGLIFFCHSPRQFDDYAMYQITRRTRGGTVLGQSVKSGGELNGEAAATLQATRVVGSILLTVGGFLFIRELGSGRL